MTEAVSTSETSVTFYQTKRRNNPDDSNLRIRRRENMKSTRKEFSPVQWNQVVIENIIADAQA
jgi:hypothetical protein